MRKTKEIKQIHENLTNLWSKYVELYAQIKAIQEQIYGPDFDNRRGILPRLNRLETGVDNP